ncbi:hypothetical protein DL95DRAFT_465879 [Leptodontidium sp. 2 PMI_412]|nr:hypothetical protein DL95DRAFT_465879 [Leptodontidium sp. 2 PMI_412]
MKLPTSFLILALPLLTTALLTSGYERIFYYYAYLLDVSLSPPVGRPLALAPGCPYVPCTFNNFIGYLNNLPTPPSLTNLDTPPIDTTARPLNSLSLAGLANLERLIPGIDSSIPHTFIRISDIINNLTSSNTLNSQQQVYLNNTRITMSRIQFLRSVQHSDALVAYLKGWAPTLPLITSIQTYDGDGRTGQFPFLNLAETIKQNTDPNIDVLKIVEGFDGIDGSGAGGLATLGALWASVNVTYC